MAGKQCGGTTWLRLCDCGVCSWNSASEIIFEVTEAEEGGYCASALGYGINTQADSLEDLRMMVRDAVDFYFDEPKQAPGIIRLHFVRDEVLAR